MAKKGKVKSIRRRWMVNSIGVVLFIVLLAISAFAVAISGYYYNSMSSSMLSRATASVGALKSRYRTVSEFYQGAESVLENDTTRNNNIDIQFIDANGAIRFSSFGLIAFSEPGTPDIAAALDSETPREESWSGTNPDTGERIMAVSYPLIVNGRSVGAVRCVTALRLVDRQIAAIITVTILVGMIILAIVYFSNLYFVRSIVEPVAGITETAKRIAAGSYGIQIEKRYDDEIGSLTDAINDMSLRIRESEKMKSEFISSVSHELRTPLTAINGWAETIQSGEVRDAEDVKRGMSIIVSEAKRLTNMVEELLEFSRIEDGRFTLSTEPIDIKAEFEDAVYTYREFFRRGGIELVHTDCEEEFPLISGDPERLRQVFCNLLDNAAKHGGAGKRIDTAIAMEDSDVVITIRDYGPGIPEEELPRVKDKFYKGSSKARGSGIGLAVCEEIVTLHGGELNIGNAEGGGCRVTIRLPLEA